MLQCCRLIAHLNYKHAELSKKEREEMITKGDKLLEKLRDISSNRLLAYRSRILPMLSPTVDITRQITPIHFPSLAQAETISISVTAAATTTSNDQSLIPISATTDIISTNHILKKMIESVKFDGNDETSLKRIKSNVLDFDNFDTEPSIIHTTGIIVYQVPFKK
ncbi:unnamed protein product [Onchocerca flexuosa]|uniref:Uncharacterized protein n=1 Tax=Onchocerca flexuosa TaxID=387005 RepID=A0A183HFR0_9BILA|nr:unnamed protein product [Onchocerca flexuosa]